MKYVTAKEIANTWGISEQLVRRYCKDGRIENVHQKDGVWYIPGDAEKPSRKKKEELQVPILLQALYKQSVPGGYSGLYDYLQINMSYSNNRMASKRLTRQQVEELYKTDKVFTINEKLKLNDIIETRNHFNCVDYVLAEAMSPLAQSFIQKLHSMIYSDCCGHGRTPVLAGGYRKKMAESKYGKTTPPKEIHMELGNLLREYEKQTQIGAEEVLDFHVRFERIRPFEDCNGRVGRLLMLKECLRHDILPFIIDDKRRSGYLEGIRRWDENRGVLMDVCMEAQMRFEAQVVLQELLERHERQQR